MRGYMRCEVRGEVLREIECEVMRPYANPTRDPYARPYAPYVSPSYERSYGDQRGDGREEDLCTTRLLIWLACCEENLCSMHTCITSLNSWVVLRVRSSVYQASWITLKLHEADLTLHDQQWYCAFYSHETTHLDLIYMLQVWALHDGTSTTRIDIYIYIYIFESWSVTQMKHVA